MLLRGCKSGEEPQHYRVPILDIDFLEDPNEHAVGEYQQSKHLGLGVLRINDQHIGSIISAVINEDFFAKGESIFDVADISERVDLLKYSINPNTKYIFAWNLKTGESGQLAGYVRSIEGAAPGGMMSEQVTRFRVRTG